MPLNADALNELDEPRTRLFNLTRSNGYPGQLQVDAGLPMTGHLPTSVGGDR